MARIVFAGTADFSTVILQALAEHHDVLHVFSQPDRPTGRKQILEPTPVKKLCDALDILCSQPERIEDDSFWDNPPAFDFLITASYGQMIPGSILSVASVNSLNVHGSLLPKYRGASPIQNALLNGDKTTGVSIIQMVKKMDAGDIYLQQELDIQEDDTSETLFTKLAVIGGDVLLKTLEIYDSIRPLPQDELLVTHCRKIGKSDGEVNWRMDAREIHNAWKAFTPWPGIYTFFEGKRLKLLDVSVVEDDSEIEAGLVFMRDDIILVGCGRNALRLHRLQLEGKNPLVGADFLRGNEGFVGSVLGV